MRKVLMTFLIILIILMSASFAYARTATVNTRNLNFRDGATTYGTNIIKKLRKILTFTWFSAILIRHGKLYGDIAKG